ncbi:MAG: HEAT repeat domain-containing protein [Phycisphaerales bacterium]|nr:MAG: HEAT repeat domain-containing protein [Phycisphaerales bacterium]
MSKKLLGIKNLVVICVVLVWIQGAYAQDADQLLNQLRGKAEAPKRSAEQMTRAYRAAVDYLLPLMSADDVGSRYEHQIALQDMGSHAARSGAEAEREALARVLCRTVETAEMPATVRHWFVLQIERIGKEESVETLTNLLSSKDRELRDYARRALEKNPSQAALRSLESTLKQTKNPAWRTALLNSYQQRPEYEAITAQKPAQFMLNVLKNGTGPNQIVAAQGLVDIAGRLVKQQKFEQAMSIYVELNNWALSQQNKGEDTFYIRAAALNGMAMCDGSRAAEVVALAMASDSQKVRSIAVQAARNAPTKDAMRSLSAMLFELEPYYQRQVLGLIVELGDLSSVKVVRQVLDSADESVRLAAIDALAQVGDDKAAESLLEIAAGGEGAVGKAAHDGLALMAGPGVDDVIKEQAASGDAGSRVVAIGLFGERRTAGAVETLLNYAGEDNAQISAAAFKSLAAVADSSDIAALADLLAGTKDRQARQSAVATLKSVLAGSDDKDAVTRVIIERMETSDADAKLSLLTTLNASGGPVALKAVTEAARSSDEALRGAGIRTLGDWPDYEAAPILLGIASRPETSLTHHVLTIRGAVRLIRAATSAPLGDRADLCFSAFDYARREDEKKEAISAMGSVPDRKVAERLLELARNGRLKIEAGLAAVELAGNMARTNSQAARALAKTIRDMDLSAEINRRADNVIRGRRRR